MCKDIYRLLTDYFTPNDKNKSYKDNRREGKKRASEWLYAHGIKGIKFLDGNSRRKGKGTYNYVAFNDKDLKITAVNESDHWSKDEGWEDYIDDTASFSIQDADDKKLHPYVEVRGLRVPLERGTYRSGSYTNTTTAFMRVLSDDQDKKNQEWLESIRLLAKKKTSPLNRSNRKSTPFMPEKGKLETRKKTKPLTYGNGRRMGLSLAHRNLTTTMSPTKKTR